MRTSMVAVLLGLSLAGAVATPATGASAPIVPTNLTKLLNVNSDKCADVEAWSLENGAAVHQWSCRHDNAKNQQWTFARSKSDPRYWNVVNFNSTKCLDIEGPSYADGAKVHQWECYGGASQDWSVENVGGGTDEFKLVNRYSGKCMDVEGASKDDGARIHQWTCRDVNNGNQRWKFYTD
ncbi:RICIN domain-containing protein [Streptomyces fildesensis]|uniref:RICIN domain-containing protein n=1 Tax=Streptomyces fildesensis TaxID=375757 RepID=A0ABW8CAE7_9ACTN